MKMPAKLYLPQPWSRLPRSLQRRINEVNDLLMEALPHPQLSYADLGKLEFPVPRHIKVRAELRRSLKHRSRQSYGMTHEIAAFSTARQWMLRVDDSLYDASAKVRSLLFGGTEPLRRFNMSIVYHKWMLIPPPAPGDPVFLPLARFLDGPALYGALASYLTLLTAHPFSDGNGRTARLMFNLLLARGQSVEPHYLPLCELTRMTGGVYEELIASACQHGNFLQLIWHLLNLIEAYALFVKNRARRCEAASDIAQVLAIVSGQRRQNNINDVPPYPVSMLNTLQHQSDGIADAAFVERVLTIANKIAEYGEIDFAMTGVADLLASASTAKSGSIVFFLATARKEELQMRLRELRASAGTQLRVQVVVSSLLPVRDAKLLIALAAQFTSKAEGQHNFPILLHDFPPGRPPDSETDELDDATSEVSTSGAHA